jgi:hypothetical protein
MNAFVDESTECAICLAPFIDTDDGDNDDMAAAAAAATIVLACGHRWHVDCLREQLRTALPNHAQRLVFTGCRCAKCGTFCEDIPELEDLIRQTDVLRERVDELIRVQLRVDDAAGVLLNKSRRVVSAPPGGAENEEEEEDDDRKVPAAMTEALMDHGRRTYAFYLCAGCDSPYFGGTIECADAAEGERPSEDRYCPSCCVPNNRVGCRHLQDHQGLQIFKCRYCCQPADFVCYGTVHFCRSCHERNSERVRQRQIGLAKRPALEAIPCPGSSCPFPKINGAASHLNGDSAKCEQVYYCAGCESSAATSSLIVLIPPGGPNWIRNPSGEAGDIQHWTPQQPRLAWKVETDEDDGRATNFVSTYHPCIMSQSVSLVQYVTDPDAVTIEVSARFKGRTDCPSMFRLIATRLDGRGRTIEQRDTGALAAPADAWERTSLILSPHPGTHTIVLTAVGQDSMFWAGNFGSKVKDCSVRVLGENLDGILLSSSSPTATTTTSFSSLMERVLRRNNR